MRIKKILRKNKGFTLVETVVVIAIMAILASGVTFGIIQYQKHAEFKKNNEYAEMLFLATQSQLTYYKSSGELEDFAKEIKGDKVSAEIAEYAKDKKGQLIHVDLKPSLADSELKKTEVYKLTKDYISDKSIYSGAIRIELDPASGTVFSVSYSTKAKSFVETDEAASESAVSVSVKMRKNESLRKDVMLGYYDTDIHFRKLKENDDDIGDIDTDSSGLINDETLRVVIGFDDPNPAAITNGVYEVRLKKGGSLVSKFTINDGKGNNTLPNSYASKRVETVVNYKENGNDKDEQECSFEVYIAQSKNGANLGIILDAIDIEAVRQLNKTKGTDAALSPTTYAKTYSGIRLGLLDNEVLTAEIMVKEKTGTVVDTVKTKEETSFFVWDGQSNQGNNRTSREVAYPRHLYNIRFFEELGKTNTYTLKGNVEFGKKVSGINAPAVFDNGNKENNLLKENAYFPAIPVLKAGHKISGGTGISTKTLTKFVLEPNGKISEKDTTTQTELGLISKNQGTIENLKIEEFKVRNVTAEITQKSAINIVGGLVGINKGKLENVSIKDLSLKVDENVALNGVGGLVAINEGSITNAFIQDSAINAKDAINVGGFVGENNASGKFSMSIKEQQNGKSDEAILIYRNLSKNIEVSGKEKVGGLFGSNFSATMHKNAENQSKWYQYVSIKDVTVNGTNQVGGLIGRNEAEVGDYVALGAKVAASEDYAGGVLGYNTGKYALETGPTDNVVYPIISALSGYEVSGRSNIGGIAGANTQTGIIEYYCAREQKVTASGDFVGGLVGDNGGKIEITSGSPSYKGQVVKASVTSDGSYVGGIAGRNSGNILGYEVQESSVIGAGNYVGGAIGQNTGSYGFNQSRHIATVKVTVEGVSYVGGVIGENTGSYTHDNWTMGIVDQVAVKGQNSVGGIVGKNTSVVSYVSIKNSSIVSENAGNALVGGAIGHNAGSFIFRKDKIGVINQVTVTGEGNQIGGVVGYSDNNALIQNVNIKDSSISGKQYVGGLVGLNKGTLENTSDKDITPETTNITGVEHVGGLAGRNAGSGLIKKYSFKNLTINASGSAGGICGSMADNASLENTKVENITITGGKNGSINGGLVGSNGSTLDLTKGNVVSGTITLSPLAASGVVVGNNSGTVTGVVNSSVTSINADFALTEEYERADSYRGGIAGDNSGVIRGVVYSGNINSSYGTRHGGITGRNKGTIEKCFMDGNIQISKANASVSLGGIAGDNSGTISDSGFTGNKEIVIGQQDEVSLKGDVGGIVGINQYPGVIKDVASANKKVTLRIDKGNLGGIVGNNTNAIVENCHTSKEVSLQLIQSGNLGGIAGIIYTSGDIKECSNKATIDGTQATHSGGIVAYYEVKANNGVPDNALIENCVNSGTIVDGSKNAGGIIGLVNNQPEDKFTINKCRNYVKVVSENTVDGSGLVYGVTETSKVYLTNNFSFMTSVSPFLVSKSGTTDVVELVIASGNYYFDSKSEDQRSVDNMALGERLIAVNGSGLYDENEQMILNAGWIGNNISELSEEQIKNIEIAIESYYQASP